jgi:hypothetical protein
MIGTSPVMTGEGRNSGRERPIVACKRCQRMAFGAQLGHEGFADGDASRGFSLADALAPQFGASRPERGVQFRIRDLTAPHDRSVERRAQREHLRFSFLDERQTLADDVACRAVTTLADHALDKSTLTLADRYVHQRLPGCSVHPLT